MQRETRIRLDPPLIYHTSPHTALTNSNTLYICQSQLINVMGEETKRTFCMEERCACWENCSLGNTKLTCSDARPSPTTILLEQFIPDFIFTHSISPIHNSFIQYKDIHIPPLMILRSSQRSNLAALEI